MRLKDLSQYIEIDIDEALEERFMESEAMYVRFLRKLLTSDDYKLMEEAAEAGNLQEVLRYAHNLKGVCATLGLTGLQAQFADIQRYVIKANQAVLQRNFIEPGQAGNSSARFVHISGWF